ncbi:alpha/beta hydrolase [Dactylosporangium roseum]|uniref:Alpha/beta hydrolase n=1 Tax=Dactylosporangium roseum TaxID=47989 RepID=A0ABY5YXA9_9ACTN|nr:alpha/beta hydrolase [Dactylosporangium roseum]UWZ34390.1 alpha/beta hydrolase [Dactylosporangium roseum]
MNIEAAQRADTFVPHNFTEKTVDLGEIRMNYAVAGDAEHPALLLIPGQSESWWGYEQALPLLAKHFRAYAVDLRGQGRSSWTPGRYTLDNLGNDLVRFIDLVIGRSTIVAGLSSGGVLAAWLSAYAKPGQIRGAVWEDPPLFASQARPACGPSIHQAMGPMFAVWSKWLGDQWSVGDWLGAMQAMPREVPPVLLKSLAIIGGDQPPPGPQPPQNLREYDPEWARAFVTGTVMVGCDHEAMLAAVRVPVLFTHHFHRVDADTGHLLGAISDEQVRRVRELVEAAGHSLTYRPFPQMPHSMHGADPKLYADTVTAWASTLPAHS